jgi:ankyrin repeat protein
MVELLCSYGASRAVHLLAYDNDVRTAAAVFAANVSLADDPGALANAAVNGHEAFVRLMLRYQPDLAARVSLDEYWTIGAGTRELTELLFARGMNPNARSWLGTTALHVLAGKGDIERAALYLDHGAELDARDEDLQLTPLAWAAKSGRTAMVEFLLARGAKTTLPGDPRWATPLAWATRRGHAAVVDLLKRAGAVA